GPCPEPLCLGSCAAAGCVSLVWWSPTEACRTRSGTRQMQLRRHSARIGPVPKARSPRPPAPPGSAPGSRSAANRAVLPRWGLTSGSPTWSAGAWRWPSSSGLPSPICSPRGGYTAFAVYTPFEGTSVGEAMDAEVTKLLPEHVSREVRHALFQGVCDPHGAHASEVLVVDPPDHPRLSLVHLPDLAVAGNDVAQGLGAAMDMSFLHALVDALGDSFPDHLPLEFGEHGQHLEEGPAGRVTSVKGF